MKIFPEKEVEINTDFDLDKIMSLLKEVVDETGGSKPFLFSLLNGKSFSGKLGYNSFELHRGSKYPTTFGEIESLGSGNTIRLKIKYTGFAYYSQLLVLFAIIVTGVSFLNPLAWNYFALSVGQGFSFVRFLPLVLLVFGYMTVRINFTIYTSKITNILIGVFAEKPLPTEIPAYFLFHSQRNPDFDSSEPVYNPNFDRIKYKEQWIELEDGQSMCALINGDRGWLMYTREPGDAGFSSRNPNYDGPPEAELDFYLENGQCDQYPLAWVLSIEEIQRALVYFQKEKRPPSFITWHNDSEDDTDLK